MRATNSAGAAGFQLEPCAIEGLAEPARCGVYEVFENRQTRTGRKIGLKVVVLPATGENPAPDPVVFFAGGPGDSVTGNAAGFAANSAEILAHRDIVLVDVRGTGESNALLCSYQLDGTRPLGLLEEFLPVDEIEKCRAELEADNDLAQYTTPVLIDDVHEVVSALGYQQVNLNGGSYGTRASLVYMRRHPEGVRTAILEGAVPTDTQMPLYFARDAQVALDGVFAECAAQPSCAQAFPNLPDELETVLARAKERPVSITILGSESAEDTAQPFTWPVAIQTLRYMLYSSGSAQEVPLAIHLAAQGDYSVFARNAALYGGALGALPDGIYLSISCPEDVANIPPERIAPEAEGSFLEDYRARQQVAACKHWPHGTLPANYWDPVTSDIPTLLVTGERDPVTPPSDAYLVAKTLANSRVMIVPSGGHSYNGLEGIQCIGEIQDRFVEQASFDGLDLEGCLAAIHRPPFPTEPPAPGIELAAEQLARYPGVYKSAGEEGAPPIEISVRLEGANLLADTPFRNNLRLTPTSETDFRIEGAPRGYGFQFELSGDRATTLILLQPGEEPTRIERVEPEG